MASNFDSILKTIPTIEQTISGKTLQTASVSPIVAAGSAATAEQKSATQNFISGAQGGSNNFAPGFEKGITQDSIDKFASYMKKSFGASVTDFSSATASLNDKQMKTVYDYINSITSNSLGWEIGAVSTPDYAKQTNQPLPDWYVPPAPPAPAPTPALPTYSHQQLVNISGAHLFLGPGYTPFYDLDWLSNSASDANIKKQIIADAKNSGCGYYENSNYNFPGSFATGGKHKGGARIVGEKGPELEVTDPSQIFDAQSTSQILRNMNAPINNQISVINPPKALNDNNQKTIDLTILVQEMKNVKDEIISLRKMQQAGTQMVVGAVNNGTSATNKMANAAQQIGYKPVPVMSAVG